MVALPPGKLDDSQIRSFGEETFLAPAGTRTPYHPASRIVWILTMLFLYHNSVYFLYDSRLLSSCCINNWSISRFLHWQIINQSYTINYQNYIIKYITVKIPRFLQIIGIINRTLKPSQVQKHTRLKCITFWHFLLYSTNAKLGQLENRMNPEWRQRDWNLWGER